MTRTSILEIAGGVRVVTPDSAHLITPYVLYEQQDWFEDEIGFLRRVLMPGQQAIDVGANYGVYTLSMAKAVNSRLSQSALIRRGMPCARTCTSAISSSEKIVCSGIPAFSKRERM